MLLCLGCKEHNATLEEVSKIELDIQLSRFDREFANAQAEDLPELKKKYPLLFPTQYPDSIWVMKMKDSLQLEIMNEVGQTFSEFEAEEEDIKMLLRHILYYFPNTKLPDIITLTTDVDYNHRVILADTILLIGLDNYLGREHRFYAGIDRYIANDLDRKYLVSDVASAFANRLVRIPSERSFLGRMIYYGKILYLKDLWMPQAEEEEKIHYTSEELKWAKANEEQIWRYFIENELLYSTDQSLGPRFLDPAPFSKFRLELDSESPGGIGRYIGWKIVRSFMENNDISLQILIDLPPEEIFKRSRYKPNK